MTYGDGYCDVCGKDENLVLIGDDEWKGICKRCLPKVISQMKDIAALLIEKQPEKD